MTDRTRRDSQEFSCPEVIVADTDRELSRAPAAPRIHPGRSRVIAEGLDCVRARSISTRVSHLLLSHLKSAPTLLIHVNFDRYNNGSGEVSRPLCGHAQKEVRANIRGGLSMK